MNGEIAPAPGGGVEVADRRGDAAAVLVRERNRIAAVGVVAVHVAGEGKAVILHRRKGCAAESAPLVREQAAHRNPPGAAVARAAEIDIPFQLVEVGQEAVVGPAGEPHLRPLVVVALHPAHGELAVDARAAAHDAGLLEAARLGGRVERGRAVVDAQALPVKARVEVGQSRIAVEDDVGNALGRRIGARLEQGHPRRGIGREAMGQHCAGRAAAHDHVVEWVRHAQHSGDDPETPSGIPPQQAAMPGSRGPGGGLHLV